MILFRGVKHLVMGQRITIAIKNGMASLLPAYFFSFTFHFRLIFFFFLNSHRGY